MPWSARKTTAAAFFSWPVLNLTWTKVTKVTGDIHSGTFKIRAWSVVLESFPGENLGVSALACPKIAAFFSHPSNMIKVYQGGLGVPTL